jgi:hypothetical protein
MSLYCLKLVLGQPLLLKPLCELLLYEIIVDCSSIKGFVYIVVLQNLYFVFSYILP